MTQYKRIGVTVKTGLDHKNESVEQVLRILENQGVDICFDPARADEIDCAKNLETYKSTGDIDLLLVIGGDGTILRAVREMPDLNVPILSVNRGTVGFLAETKLDEAEELIPALLSGNGVIEQRSIMNVEVLRKSKVQHSGIALNEAVIAQGTIARLVNLDTTVNSEPLTMYHADGLIISTPTGSTAYSLAAGGPIVHPGLSATILTPINPHSFTQKPVVLRGDSVVTVTVRIKQTRYDEAKVYLTTDGQTSVPLEHEDVVRVRAAPKTVKFLRRAQDTFFGTLREKLKWGERID